MRHWEGGGFLLVDSPLFSPPVDVNDFLTEEQPEYNWCIPEILEHGDRVIFTGNEGKGKSTLLRQLGIQVSMGVHPFTLEDIERKKVWLIDLENPRSLVRREIEKIKAGRAIDPGWLTVTTWPQGIDLGVEAFRTTMAAWLKLIAPDLLIIGPMYKMLPGGTETEDAASQLASEIDMWRLNHQCAVAMEAHQPHQTILNKSLWRPERPVGSSLWMRWPEFGICLEDDGRLRHWRGARDEREWPEKLTRGNEWFWETDMMVGKCLNCSLPLTGSGRIQYCNDGCRKAKNQKDFRARQRTGSTASQATLANELP